MTRLKAMYGEHPAHLVGFALMLAISGFAVRRFFDQGSAVVKILVWLAGAAIAHDLLFAPVYMLVGRALERLGSRANYVRVPALLSGAMFLVFFPLIVRRGEGTYRNATTLTQHPYLARWLIASGILFAGSAVFAVLRTARSNRSHSSASPGLGP